MIKGSLCHVGEVAKFRNKNIIRFPTYVVLSRENEGNFSCCRVLASMKRFNQSYNGLDFGKYAYSLSSWELDEKIGNTLLFVRSIFVYFTVAMLSTTVEPVLAI